MAQKKYIYIPIEVKVRELIPKMYLASFLLDHGFNCIIGDRSNTYQAMNFLPKGSLFLKDIAKEKLRRISKLKEKSSYVVCMDEEAGIALTELSTFFKKRISQDTLDIADRFYCYGEFDYNYLVDVYEEDKNKFSLMGSPRIDIWKVDIGGKIFEEDILEIKEKFGNFILINSSIGIASKEKIEFQIQQALEFGYITDQEVPKYRRRQESKLQKLHNFADLVNRLAEALPEQRFILRPHPAEKIEDWKKLIHPKDNIHVIREGDVTPWVLSSKIVIHEGCTTAIQSLIAKKPIISIRNLISVDENVDKTLNDFPNKISRKVEDFEELCQVITSLMHSDNWEYFKQKEFLIKERIHNLNGENGARNIAEDLAKIEGEKYSDAAFELMFQYMSFRQSLSKVKQSVISLIRKERSGNSKLKVRDVVDKKIPGGIQAEEARVFFERLDSSGMSGKIKVRQLKDNLILIKKD